MRRLILVAPAALLLLSACNGMGGANSYSNDIERLGADCQARGGILTPTGMTTGRAETEYACKINGEPARAGG